jgi:hypothetical protein
VNMISAMSAEGLLRFGVFTGSFTAATFIGFCRRLLADTACPVYQRARPADQGAIPVTPVEG